MKMNTKANHIRNSRGKEGSYTEICMLVVYLVKHIFDRWVDLQLLLELK